MIDFKNITNYKYIALNSKMMMDRGSRFMKLFKMVHRCSFFLSILFWNYINICTQIGEESDVRELLGQGIDVNAVDESGSSALHFAVNAGKIKKCLN